eukprot:gnl/TRDRNA2_/TRDRNA2_168068_c0_seq1.p1 gnl/TRDRNA2_/TRDRNA2_168068_c0~~gnl/TRDRNA2_/TRDRNA2_168068_c0_seq1.p1  ORF type:complete len:346 (-),score=94.43 gnl/TRDRNA2_/TRDRNA2_168068_c0_seq1:107-1144(-)
MALCRTLLLALFASALGAEVQQTDEFSALQTEISAKAKATTKNSAKLDDFEPESSSVTCPNMPNMVMDGGMCADASYQTRISSSSPAADAVPEAVAAEESIQEVPEPTIMPSEEASPSTEIPSETVLSDEPPCFLRYVLQFLIIAVFADGFRRSRQSSAAVTAKPAPVECNKPAAAAGRADLFKAVHSGDAKACKALLMQGVPVTGEDQSGNTPLHAAVKTGSTAVVKLLLQKGAKVNVMDAWDDTPLHTAACHHQSNAEELCDLLIKHGAKVNALNAQDWTPLVVAGSAGKRAVCEFLLAHGATTGDVPEASLPPMLRLLLQGEEPEAPEPEVVEKQSFDVSAM